MALVDIQNHIEEKTKATVQQIESEASRELKARESEWQSKLAAERNRVLHDAKATADSKLSQIKFKIRERAHAEKLMRMQKHLDDAYAAELTALEKLSAEQYTDLLVSLLQPLAGEEGTLVTSKARVNELKSAAKKAGVKAPISDKTIDTVGGFIFEGKKIDVDNRFESIMERVKEESLIEVNATLFAD